MFLLLIKILREHKHGVGKILVGIIFETVGTGHCERAFAYLKVLKNMKRGKQIQSLLK